ncbi:MAG TPA: PTS system mannose/fructose/sorbose family transporter subunit IID [Clostridia bacterium]|nr:PTS system mannose/fructose/sorbose family transporter subunit IID [Clostridia bacterium]
MDNNKKLSKTDLLKSFFCWHMFAQSCYNFERFQALGFVHSMIPIISKLYHTKEEISQALKRHLTFFNTEANFGSMIPGMIAALEEEKANGNTDITDETINSLKTGLMGPFAGIGDTITQGLVKTVLLAITVDIAAKGNAFGPILFFILFTTYVVGVGYFMYFQGYKWGKNALSKITGTNVMQKITEGMNVLGLTVLGALVAAMVNIKTPLVFKIQQTTIEVQQLLDKIVPNLLSLMTVFLLWYLLKKNKSVVSLIIWIFIIGIIAAYFKIL